MQSMANTTTEPIIVVLTVTSVESKAVFAAFLGREGKAKHRTEKGVTYQDLGLHSGQRIIHAKSEMGPMASASRTRDAIRSWKPKACIAVGIAFGMDDKKQNMGDVLVSKQMQEYDLSRVNDCGTLTPRGDKVRCSDVLVSRLRATSDDTTTTTKVHFGLMLSGSKLIDCEDYRQNLKSLFVEAIGGEMEGSGLYQSAVHANTDWAVIKAICDWGDGNKGESKEANQNLAAKNAACFLKDALDLGGPLYKNDDQRTKYLNI